MQHLQCDKYIGSMESLVNIVERRLQAAKIGRFSILKTFCSALL